MNQDFVDAQCVSCTRKNKACSYHTKDLSEWVSIEGGWLILLLNGVALLACSATCAEKYIASFGDRPHTVSTSKKTAGKP